MTFTSHGHHIPGTADGDEPRGVNRARCGGPNICQVCRREALHVPAYAAKFPTVGGLVDDPFPNRDQPFSFKTFMTQPETVSAVLMSTENARGIAEFFRGRVVDDENADRWHVLIPTLDGPLKAYFGEYLLFEDDRELVTMTKADFDAKYVEAYQIGVAQQLNHAPSPTRMEVYEASKRAHPSNQEAEESNQGIAERIRKAESQIRGNERGRLRSIFTNHDGGLRP